MAKNNGKHSFIIIDNPENIEKHVFDNWYTNYANNSSGIWIGNGIENQNMMMQYGQLLRQNKA